MGTTAIRTRYKYYVDADAADQGAATTRSTQSLKDIVTDIGTSTYATVVFPNSQGASSNYVVSSSLDLSSYSKLNFEFHQGAFIKPDASIGVKFYSPDNILAGKRQRVFMGSGNIRFAYAGDLPAMWFYAGSADGKVRKAIKSLPTAGGVVSIQHDQTLSAGQVAAAGKYISGNTRMWNYQDTLADDASIDLPSSTQGMLMANAKGNNVHSGGLWSVTTAGTVDLIYGASTAASGDHDDKFCVKHLSHKGRIRNRLGASGKLTAHYFYK